MGEGKEPQTDAKTSGAAKMWAATAVLALLILGGAVFVGKREVGYAPIPEPPVSVAAPEPEMAPLSEEKPLYAVERPETPPAPAPVEAKKEEPPPKPSRPQLALDHLAGTLKLSSPVVAPGLRLPLAYTCNQKNISPPLQWSGAPPETKSFALFMERRDPGQEPKIVWTLYGVGAAETALPENVSREAELENGWRQGKNDFNNTGYVGPCEPRGKVNYALRLFALDTVLDLPGNTKPDDLINAMNGHIVDAAELPFIYYFRA